MNIASLTSLRPTLRSHGLYLTRRFFVRRRSTAFSSSGDNTAIQRIYVINLDRAQERWSRLNRDLSWLRDMEGRPLDSITRRFSAIDARYLQGQPSADLLKSTYTLAEQLLVDPHPKLDVDDATRATRISMTPQEIAVALSHIEVWKLIAAGNVPYTLVLEDDAYVTRTCMSVLRCVWDELRSGAGVDDAVDLLYLSYQETGVDEVRTHTKSALRQPTRGLWQLSGYVLSRAGAEKLLSLLPAHGPIDLWINLQFSHLSVRMTDRPVIEQRPGITSSNSYSVLPILAKVGAIQRDAPRLARRQPTSGPIVVVGAPGTGLSTVAKALSVLGFRCISDLTDLPPNELGALLRGGRHRVFDAYVNIGSLGPDEIQRIAAKSPMRLITTTGQTSVTVPFEFRDTTGEGLMVPRHRRLMLPVDDPDPWERLARFLGCDYPTHPWPRQPDLGQRRIAVGTHPSVDVTLSGRRLTWDKSPWVIERTGWSGIALESSLPQVDGSEVGNGGATDGDEKPLAWRADTPLDGGDWYLRDDTFPSNRALFRPGNVTQQHGSTASLTLRREASKVRDLTGAAVASGRSFTYGTFGTDLRVPSGSGLVTGLFLHRNGPRQEIDIEFLGRDTTRMLVNVFYNPGATDTKLEYGYRGTPVLIDLGFDASKAFHHYEIEWRPECIRWHVDGITVHERLLWGPTPIPNQPMEFNVNLWSSESAEFAGPLDERALPAVLEVASLEVHG
ncbi:family 16 glycosylhydrolase [Streptomyces sp. GESEQ-35]|uniref:family 16 glycosylhydrolase n=1 Tax=Streptomyces sp. GESEQ-35 TaxID=2812657 RepID=UPI001B33595B|nr:family 16 glycosylhydrolase [Streptomyces sp. GESEQ-35]